MPSTVRTSGVAWTVQGQRRKWRTVESSEGHRADLDWCRTGPADSPSDGWVAIPPEVPPTPTEREDGCGKPAAEAGVQSL